ncbi:unnamed protein product, partial [Prorocentrum cordatum]
LKPFWLECVRGDLPGSALLCQARYHEMALTFVGASPPASARLQESQRAPASAPPALRAPAAHHGAGGGSLGAALPVGAVTALAIASRRPARVARRAAFDPSTQLGAMAPVGFLRPGRVQQGGRRGSEEEKPPLPLLALSARTKWARRGWVQCPSAVPVHFDQDSLSVSPRPVPIRNRRPLAQQRPLSVLDDICCSALHPFLSVPISGAQILESPRHHGWIFKYLVRAHSGVDPQSAASAPLWFPQRRASAACAPRSSSTGAWP